MVNSTILMPDVIDCACVIHGDAYAWTYVDRLYNMLQRNLTPSVRLHVYTESKRSVPAHMIKHSLEDWGGVAAGPKKSWWYKMQLFNSEHHAGALLYFDLDVVIVNNIDWIWQQPSKFFWAIRDFRYLWKSNHYSVNSSLMWWNTQQFDYVWQDFKKQHLPRMVKQYRGDQDYINQAITTENRRFYPVKNVQSWRWQCLDGGFDFDTRKYLKPNTGTTVSDDLSVMIFHGKPKPDQVNDLIISQHWI